MWVWREWGHHQSRIFKKQNKKAIIIKASDAMRLRGVCRMRKDDEGEGEGEGIYVYIYGGSAVYFSMRGHRAPP